MYNAYGNGWGKNSRLYFHTNKNRETANKDYFAPRKLETPKENMSLSFPNINPTCKWHNPNKLTPAEFGVLEGWRPLLKLEAAEKEDQMYAIETKKWKASSIKGGLPLISCTYRTLRPLPKHGLDWLDRAKQAKETYEAEISAIREEIIEFRSNRRNASISFVWRD